MRRTRRIAQALENNVISDGCGLISCQHLSRRFRQHFASFFPARSKYDIGEGFECQEVLEVPRYIKMLGASEI